MPLKIQVRPPRYAARHGRRCRGLFSKFIKLNPEAPRWFDRDRFVLSAGHGSMLMYSLLYLMGYEDITIDDIMNFRQLGAKPPVTRNMGTLPALI